MTQESSNLDFAELAARAEQAVAGIKDQELKRIAFEKFLENLLGEQPGTSTTRRTSRKKTKTKNASAKTRASEPRRSKRSTSLSIVKDLNLRPRGKKPLRDFVADKAPENVQEAIAVMVYYLQHELETEDISRSYIYTCFKDLADRKYKVPTNMAQTLRNIAYRKGWIDTNDPNSIRVTIPGENFVEHDLPRDAED